MEKIVAALPPRVRSTLIFIVLASLPAGCARDEQPSAGDDVEPAALKVGLPAGSGTPSTPDAGSPAGTGGLAVFGSNTAVATAHVTARTIAATRSTPAASGDSASPSQTNPTDPTAPSSGAAAPDAMDPNAPPATDPQAPDGTDPTTGASSSMCAPGSHLCAGSLLLVCSAAGGQWLPQTTCAYDGLCDAANGRCMACVPFSTVCAGLSIPFTNATTSMVTCAPDGMSYWGETICPFSCSGGHCQ